MRAVSLSPQEEETLALLAVARLGECTAHEVARELGVETVRHTLGRLVDGGRLLRFCRSEPDGRWSVMKYSQAPAKVGAPTERDTCHVTRPPSIA